jgi:hypothetical protein
MAMPDLITLDERAHGFEEHELDLEDAVIDPVDEEAPFDEGYGSEEPED